MSELEILQMVVGTTAHITQETAMSTNRDDADQLPLEDLRRWVDNVRYGFLITVPEEPYEKDIGPADLRVLMDWARKKGFRKVLLDTDGNPIEGLPLYDW